MAPEGVVTIPEVIAGNVRAFRLLRRLEQEHVADRMWSLGHTWRRATVSEVERARRNVTVPELLALVVVLGANIEQLLDPRGPGGRTGPRMALPVQLPVNDAGEPQGEWLSVEPEDISGLVCSHKVYAEVEWKRRQLSEVEFTRVRSDLTDVGPGGAS